MACESPISGGAFHARKFASDTRPSSVEKTSTVSPSTPIVGRYLASEF